MVRIKVLFFASLKDRAGVKETSLELIEGIKVVELKRMLCELYPGLAPAMGSALVAVNKEYAFDEDAVPSGAEVALFPPVSGGVMNYG